MLLTVMPRAWDPEHVLRSSHPQLFSGESFHFSVSSAVAFAQVVKDGVRSRVDGS